jgi:hypothetical protein
MLNLSWIAELLSDGLVDCRYPMPLASRRARPSYGFCLYACQSFTGMSYMRRFRTYGSKTREAGFVIYAGPRVRKDGFASVAVRGLPQSPGLRSC